MKPIILSMAAVCALSAAAYQNIPPIQTDYTADPAPVVIGDTLFLYTSHDEDDAQGYGFKMLDWLLYTTVDMANWTACGPVASLKAFDWRRRDNGAWAQQVVERGGKYYMYCPLHGNGIGVLRADSPYGPFVDPLGHPLVWQREHWDDIDPTVMTDSDGQAYMYWGNPNTYAVMLGEDMISTKGEIVKFPRITDYQEGPWLWKKDGRYYLSFASTCCPEGIGYAMAPGPMGPWEYKGHIMDHTVRTRGNHPGIVEYKGRWWVFGQDYDVLRLDTPDHHERRNVDFAPMTYNSDGTIQEVPYFRDHEMTQLQWLDPYRRVEAETMAWGKGLKPIKLGVRRVVIGSVDPGEYTMVRGVDFGSKGPASVSINASCAGGGGSVELRLDSADGPVVATVKIAPTGSVDDYRDFTAKVRKCTGVHDLYFVYSGAEGADLFRLDYWQMNEKN